MFWQQLDLKTHIEFPNAKLDNLEQFPKCTFVIAHILYNKVRLGHFFPKYSKYRRPVKTWKFVDIYIYIYIYTHNIDTHTGMCVYLTTITLHTK